MIKETENGIVISVHVQPDAKKSEIIGIHGESLKIKIQAPAVDGAANEALIKFIAKTLNVSNHQVSLLGGEKGRQKRLLIETSDKKSLLIKFSELGYA